MEGKRTIFAIESQSRRRFLRQTATSGLGVIGGAWAGQAMAADPPFDTPRVPGAPMSRYSERSRYMTSVAPPRRRGSSRGTSMFGPSARACRTAAATPMRGPLLRNGDSLKKNPRRFEVPSRGAFNRSWLC
jgi:hypothetical protein